MAARSYRQFCGLARALDAVGDRWALLIVRELLIEPRRYGELQQGLPGIASNLLAERLRQLESTGLIERQLGGPGEGVRYALTSWGQGLREPIDALIRWSTPLMVTGRGDDHFDARWLVVALGALLHGRRSTTPRTAAANVEGQTITIRLDRDGAHIHLRPTDGQRASMPPGVLLGLAAGLDPAALAASGEVEPAELSRLTAVLTGHPLKATLS